MTALLLSIALAQSSVPMLVPPPDWKRLALPPAPPGTITTLVEFQAPSRSVITLERAAKASVSAEVSETKDLFATLMPGVTPVVSTVQLCGASTGTLVVFATAAKVKVAIVYAAAGDDVVYAQYMSNETGPNEPEAVTAITSLCPVGTLP